MFWIVAILMTAIVAATIAWPMFRHAGTLPSRAEHDVEVYDAQLRELRDDVERGTVPPAEAATARAEIARRLLRASSEAENERPITAVRRGFRFAVVPALLIVAAATPLYLRLGAPAEPDQPLMARLAVDPAKADVATLVAQAEARLRDDPNDGRGWETLVPVYLRMGRNEDAVTAAGNAIRLLGSSAERQLVLGDAQVRSAGGEITDAAARSFEVALKADPENGVARFFLAARLWQQKRSADATAAWQSIVEKGPPDAAWVAMSRRALEEARRLPAVASSQSGEPPRPGPSADDVAAASRLSDGDRSEMIQGMVSQLADRLKSAPNDPDGWKRLMRSYAVLGKQTEAREAYTKAQGVFADGSADRRSIDEFAEALGLGGEKAVP